MLKKLDELVNGGDASLRDRLFRLVLLTASGVVALAIIAGFALQNAWLNTAPLLILGVMIGIVSLLTFRYHKTDLAAALLGLLITCFFFPMMFFLSGGIDSGASVWFVLGILYIFLMFSGKSLAVFLMIAVCADILTYRMAYRHSDWIIALSSKAEIYYDSLFAVLIVGFSIGAMMWFQNHAFEKERAITQEQKEEIERISRSKDDFFANISHEIRTPINTIIGLNEMILRQDASEEILEDAENIRSASKMLLALVNEILDFSKLENQKMEIVPVQYRTRNLFEELISHVQIRMKEKRLEFLVDIDKNLPSILLGDERRIKQIILNVLTNAVKYTHRGSVTLSVASEYVSEDVISLKVTVSDTGVGIKKEDLENLYESFHRMDVKKNRIVEGTGLGLAISKQLLDLMGGEITVDSIYMHGTHFTITLQQKVIDSTPLGMFDFMSRSRKGVRSRYRQSFEAPEARILIVDDDETNLVVASKLLRATKLQIDTAKDGNECLEQTQKKIYNVILLDHLMPGMDGVETLKRIKTQENGLCRQVPVIALTANTLDTSDKNYLDYGFDGYLQKPVDGSMLEEEILKFLPEDLVEYRMNAEQQKSMSEAVKRVLNRKRRKIAITTDSVCDLPPELVQKYRIGLIYLYIRTASGNFCDTKEIDADSLSRYMAKENGSAHSISITVEEYETLFADTLTEAEEVIHISMSESVGQSCKNAIAAAEGFGHVHVIDSGNISCAQGLMVLYAASLAERRVSVNVICGELLKMRERLESNFLMPSITTFFNNGYTDRFTARVCRFLKLHPALRICEGRLKVNSGRRGRIQSARKRFIRRSLFWRRYIDNRVVYITHAGCTLEEQKEVVGEVLKRVPFQKVIIQKASVSVSCNTGIGTIGIAYLKKGKKDDWI